MVVSNGHVTAGERSLCRYVQVLLDGEPQQFVEAADEHRGIVLAYALDDAGRTIRTGKGRAARVLRRGKVELRLSDEAPDWARDAWAERLKLPDSEWLELANQIDARIEEMRALGVLQEAA